MGIFSVTMQVGDPEAREFRDVSALVDTGASHTMLPAPLLHELGVEAHTDGEFKLATGEIVTRDSGRAWVRLDGGQEMTLVVFGDEGSPALLDAVTLEEFGLGVDPIARRLISVPRMLLQRRRTLTASDTRRYDRRTAMRLTEARNSAQRARRCIA